MSDEKPVENENKDSKPAKGMKIDLVTYQQLEEIAKRTVKRYYRSKGQTKCPNCDKLVDTVIISNGKTVCPFCQRLNWFDLLSVIAKTPDGRFNTHAISTAFHDEENKDNNMIVKAPRLSLLSRFINIITFGRVTLKTGKFGYLKFYVNSALLQKPKDFKDKYIVIVGVTTKELVTKYFGDVAMTVKHQITPDNN